MSAINELEGLSGYGVAKQDPKAANDMGREEFMQLMLAQLNHQDPFQPMENGEFLAQIAQFSTVSGINELQSSFDQFATSIQSSRALEASTLVGRSVLIPSFTGQLPDGGAMAGEVMLPASTNRLAVTIQDASGQVIKQLELGTQTAGRVQFSWDGIDEEGNAMPAGNYSISAAALMDGEMQGVETLVGAHVESVTLGQAGGEPTLNLGSGMGSIKFSRVYEIM